MLDSVTSQTQPESAPAASSSSSDYSPAPLVTRHRKIAILGFGATVRDCPWKDPSWDLWAMNGFWRAAKPDFAVEAPEERYSLWLDMHTLEYTREYGKQAGFGDAQERWLEKEHPFPIYMLDEPDRSVTGSLYPSVRAFPIEEIVRVTGRDYFTSTVAYALAFALARALTTDDIAEVGLWGIDLVHDTEYVEQRPCAEYWVGRLEAIGIKITTHAQSALLRQLHRYGYEAANPLVKEMKAMLHGQKVGLEKAVQAKQAEMEHARNQLHTDDGALQAINGMLERLKIHERGGQV